MSGAEVPGSSAIEVGDAREATVGGVRVRRTLPRHRRRTVGAWCFADQLGPYPVAGGEGLQVGPHPHMGLQTVTWLISGEAVHRDSLGNEQLITPGQLNLMTAGMGVSHAEQTAHGYAGVLSGIQLWIAQPEQSRHGPPAFEHRRDLPECAIGESVITVLIGDFNGLSSPARHDTDLLGVDVVLRSRIEVPLVSSHEHALIVLEGAVRVDGAVLVPGRFGYLGTGRVSLEMEALARSRVIILGGEPFEDPIMMWWNFVGRTREEIDRAYRSWSADDGRFGSVASDLLRIETQPPYWSEFQVRPPDS